MSRRPGRRPAVEVGVGGEPQRRREQDRALDRVDVAVLAARRRCRTTSRPATGAGGRARRRRRPRRAGRGPRPRPRRRRPRSCPAALVVPRVLKRSTAMPASAGSRQAALRNRWLSIIPPWVGSGCRHTIVATGVAVERRGELADEPQPVRRRDRERLTARRQHAVRDDLGHGSPSVRSQPATGRDSVSRTAAALGHRAPAAARVPARGVPVPPVLLAAPPVGRPGHDVRRRRADLLVAARAAVGLRRAAPVIRRTTQSPSACSSTSWCAPAERPRLAVGRPAVATSHDRLRRRSRGSRARPCGRGSPR